MADCALNADPSPGTCDSYQVDAVANMSVVSSRSSSSVTSNFMGGSSMPGVTGPWTMVRKLSPWARFHSLSETATLSVPCTLA